MLRFDASAWKEGQSAFGGGYDYIHTLWTEMPGDIWLRREFTLSAKPSIANETAVSAGKDAVSELCVQQQVGSFGISSYCGPDRL